MITSPSNSSVKQIRALRQRKEREASGLCFVEGIRQVAEALQSGAEVARLVVAPELLSSAYARELVAEHAARGAPLLELSADLFAGLSQKDGPQGLAAVVHQRWAELESVRVEAAPGWVALVEPADPGNLGTIVRTIDAAGAAGLILIGPSADPYDPAALRASMGAAFAVPLVRCAWDAFAAWKARAGVFLLGTSDSARDPFQQARYPQPLVLLMGSERQGLSDAQQALCDQVVAIPMRGRADSLNLAVATGVMLYELVRQGEEDKGTRGQGDKGTA
jgi:RNA methyltransferase, TrmH family